jgi:hypothetical protein
MLLGSRVEAGVDELTRVKDTIWGVKVASVQIDSRQKKG